MGIENGTKKEKVSKKKCLRQGGIWVETFILSLFSKFLPWQTTDETFILFKCLCFNNYQKREHNTYNLKDKEYGMSINHCE